MLDGIIIFTNQASRYIIPFLLVGIPFMDSSLKRLRSMNLLSKAPKMVLILP